MKKTNQTLRAPLTVSRKRIPILPKLFFTATAATLLAFTPVANAAIVVNGDFEIQDTTPADALAWTGENGTTIMRLVSGGVSGTAGALISNTVSTTAAGPLRQNTGFAGGDP